VSNFGDRLAEAVARKKSSVCVGLDPRPELFPAALKRGDVASQIVEFCLGVIQAAEPFAVAVKPQIAFFEEHWEQGLGAFRQVCAAARKAGLIVIADAKRGDIADTAEAYARAFFDRLDADAVTVNPYLGSDSLKPFVDRCAGSGKGLFVLAKTSNASSGDFQDLMVEGEPVYVRVARKIREIGAPLKGSSGYSPLGLVVGATHREQARRLREICPDSWFLVPGFGAQGATAEDVRVCFDAKGRGAIVNASRSLIYAYRNKPDIEWTKAVAEATQAMRDQLPC
jgi:orotidine-5'-phosphate decarboxylase